MTPCKRGHTAGRNKWGQCIACKKADGQTPESKARDARKYRRNRKRRIAQQRARYRRNRNLILARLAWRLHTRYLWLDGIKRRAGCADCRTKKGRLDFDHRDPATKVGNVADMVKDVSLADVRAEIMKCAVRCKVCHGKRTRRDARQRKGG